MVDGDEPAAVGQKHRKVPIAAEAAADRLHHEPGERRRHHSVDRVSALGEHALAGLDFAHVSGGDRAVVVSLRGHGRTSITVGRSPARAAVIRLAASSIDRVVAASQPKPRAIATRSWALASVPIGSMPSRSIESEISP